MGLIRLFLALIVLTDHARHFLIKPAGVDIPIYLELGVNGGTAVLYFYVISGFLIAYVLRHNYEPNSAGTISFFQSRLIRIFSLYWPILVLTLLLVPGAATALLSTSIANIFTSVFLFGIDWNVAFGTYPVTNTAAAPFHLMQAWTLGAELTFYAVAPFLLRSSIATWGVFALSAAVRLLTVSYTDASNFDEVWTYRFFPATVLFFLLGSIAFDLSERYSVLKHPLTGCFLIAMVPAVLMFPGYATWETPRFWLSFVLFSASMPGIFSATKNSDLMNAFGALSYPVYLIHLLIIAFFQISWTPLLALTGKNQLGALAILAVLMAVTLIGAYAAHRLVEVPVSRMMRRVIRLVRPADRQNSAPPTITISAKPIVPASPQ